MACDALVTGIDDLCISLNKVGGVAKRIYVGQLNQIDEAVLAFGVTNGEVTAFGMSGLNTLKRFISKKFKNTGKDDLTPAENGAPTWKQSVELVHYWFSQVDIKALENLCKVDDLFAIVESNNGQLFVYGLSNSASLGIDNFGLKAESQAATLGVALNDDTTTKTTLVGDIPNKPMLFIPLASLATNLVLLDGMSL